MAKTQTIDLSIGDPDLPAPRALVRRLTESLEKGRDSYSGAQGIFSLRQALGKEIGAKPENIVICPGSRWAITVAMQVLLQKGDEVIVLSPAWHGFSQIARLVGAVPKAVDCLEAGILAGELAFAVNAKRLESAISKKTKMIVINTPNNPTSAVMKKKDIALVTRLAKKHNLFVLEDTAYKDLVFKPAQTQGIFGKRVVKVGTFSKTFSMTGWRIGYVAFPDAQSAKKAVEINKVFITNVPVFIQDAALAGVAIRKQVAARHSRIFEARAKLATGMLGKVRGVEMMKPEAGIYLFARKNGMDCGKFMPLLAKKGVIANPGTMFGSYNDCIRIALTVESKTLKKGIGIIASELEKI